MESDEERFATRLLEDGQRARLGNRIRVGGELGQPAAREARGRAPLKEDIDEIALTRKDVEGGILRPERYGIRIGLESDPDIGRGERCRAEGGATARGTGTA